MPNVNNSLMPINNSLIDKINEFETKGSRSKYRHNANHKVKGSEYLDKNKSTPDRQFS